MGKKKTEETKAEEVKTVDPEKVTVDSPAEDLVIAFEVEQKRLVDFLKEKNLIKEGDNIVDTVISKIEGDAYEMGEAATALKGIGEEIEKTKAENRELKAALEEFKNSENQAEETAEIPENARPLAKGTRLKMADTEITLLDDAVITFADAQNEQKFVGMYVLSGNLDANRPFLKGKYDGLGNPE